MKLKNQVRKGKKRMDKETNSTVHKIYQEDRHGFLTPYNLRRRRPRHGEKKPKYKDHK